VRVSDAPSSFPIISWVNWYRDARATMTVVGDQLTCGDA